MSNDESFYLVDAMNTHNPALIVISKLGFEIGIHPPTYDEGEEENYDDMGLWYARKGVAELVAGDPLSLLGLVSIYENRGRDWNKSNDPDIYDEILEKTYPDE